VGTALLLALVIRTFVIQAFKIPSGSMLETLQIGDHILVNKMSYGTPVDIPFTPHEIFHTPRFGDPEHGDVVVFKFPQEPKRDFIKRVIGIPGDRIEIKDKKVYRNGELLDEPYVIHKDVNLRPGGDLRDNSSEIVVPENRYFVMGDNRDFSLDSRFWGFVDRDLIHTLNPF
jgi:signal peptidase I